VPNVADLKGVHTGLAGLEREASNLIRVACSSSARGARIGAIAQERDLSEDNGGPARAINHVANNLPSREVRRGLRDEPRGQA